MSEPGEPGGGGGLGPVKVGSEVPGSQGSVCTGPASPSACLSGVLVLNNSFERLSQARKMRTGRPLVQTPPLSHCTVGELEAERGATCHPGILGLS